MNPIATKNLKLLPRTREEVLRSIAELPPEHRAQVSPGWLETIAKSGPIDPWLHGFSVLHPGTNSVVGQGSFKGPPDADGVVEIAYCIGSEHTGKGYATEVAEALVRFAWDCLSINIVRAHTLPERNASTRVLMKNGFVHVGEIVDPEDGLVWRWEKERSGLTMEEVSAQPSA